MKIIKRKKILIERIKIANGEASRQFEIRLPANTEKITAVTITATIDKTILNG